ncbi:MAG TPA: hypothetical protein VK778_05270 [Solirubrobacteraceae bacterium]|jgi:hypothetical protein|nr:hypothetical protein [Solirubrobacteraceae bacterium]
MSPTGQRRRARAPDRAGALRAVLRVALAGLLGLGVALLVAACAGSNAKLIPVADAGPLQSDFEAVAQEAEAGNGSCTTTQAAIAKTEQDFDELPSSVDAGLRNTLRQGIDNLRSHALALCAQPLAQATVTTTAKTTPSHTATTTTTETQTTATQTTPPTATTPPASSPGGGTPAPGETPSGGIGEQGGGTGVGGSSPQGENGAANNPTENDAGGAASGPGAGGAGREAER